MVAGDSLHASAEASMHGIRRYNHLTRENLLSRHTACDTMVLLCHKPELGGAY
jgi:hypothetical protein